MKCSAELHKILRVGNMVYTISSAFFSIGECEMTNEIRELNRMLCKDCDENDYDKCKACRVYQLVNKIAAQ